VNSFEPIKIEREIIKPAEGQLDGFKMVDSKEAVFPEGR
jgi:hypothetical protein